MFPFTWNPRQKCRVHKIVFRSFWLHNRPFTLRMPRANRKIILYRSFSKFAFSRCIRVNKTRNKTLHIHQYGVFTDGQFSQINILGDFKSIGPISSRSKKTPKSFAYQQKQLFPEHSVRLLTGLFNIYFILKFHAISISTFDISSPYSLETVATYSNQIIIRN